MKLLAHEARLSTRTRNVLEKHGVRTICLLYTSDAADD